MEREYATISNTMAVAETVSALLIDFGDGKQLWIPKSQIGESSFVQSEGDEGDLDVTQWWAEKVGLV